MEPLHATAWQELMELEQLADALDALGEAETEIALQYFKEQMERKTDPWALFSPSRH